VIHKFREQTNTYPIKTKQKQPRDNHKKTKKSCGITNKKGSYPGPVVSSRASTKQKHKKTTKKFT
jgi:hypothetical protein